MIYIINGREQSSKRDTYIYGQWSLDKGVNQGNSVGKRITFSTNWTGALWIAKCKQKNKPKRSSQPLLHNINKNSKWIINLNVRASRKIIENLCDLGLDTELLSMTQKA